MTPPPKQQATGPATNIVPYGAAMLLYVTVKPQHLSDDFNIASMHGVLLYSSSERRCRLSRAIAAALANPSTSTASAIDARDRNWSVGLVPSSLLGS